jgi:Inner membrane component of T3SS, cytoplasmic domain/CHAT domain
MLSANPAGTTVLKLDEEAREIESKIRAAEHRDSLELITKWAVRPDDLLQTLNEYQPQIVHFSGHGTATEEIILLDRNATPLPVSKQALVRLFRTLKDNIRVVLLNACYSRSQAEAITEVIDCAIGMSRAIGDHAAINFAASFYRAIGFGRSILDACEQGKTALMLEGIPEEDTPCLICHTGVDPASIVMIETLDRPINLGDSGVPSAEQEDTSRYPEIDTGLCMRIISGPLAGTVCPLDRSRITIGCTDVCEIYLKSEPYCSRVHCALDWDYMQQAFVLHPFTRSGVAINGLHVPLGGEKKLEVGDLIHIGTTALKLQRATRQKRKKNSR